MCASSAQPAVSVTFVVHRIKGIRTAFHPREELPLIHTAQMSTAVPVDQSETPPLAEEKRTWKERWIPRLKLMAGLALPVYLETLDYTGTLL